MKLVNSHTHLNYPSQSWETRTTAQSPFRCSDMLPSSRMSNANNVLAQRLSLRPSSRHRARRRDPGKAKNSPFSGPFSLQHGQSSAALVSLSLSSIPPSCLHPTKRKQSYFDDLMKDTSMSFEPKRSKKKPVGRPLLCIWTQDWRNKSW